MPPIYIFNKISLNKYQIGVANTFFYLFIYYFFPKFFLRSDLFKVKKFIRCNVQFNNLIIFCEN